MPQGCACCHLWGPALARGGRQGAMPDRFWRDPPSPTPRGEAPGNAATLRCGGAARVPSDPVWAALSGLPARACWAGGVGVLGGHQLSVLWKRRLPRCARDLAPHPAQPQSGCSLLGWAVERLSATQACDSRVWESRGPSVSSSTTHTPALLGGGWGARPLASSSVAS